MRGSLGEKIGEATTADVHAWAPGQVVKLFKAGVPRQVSWHEALELQKPAPDDAVVMLPPEQKAA